MQQIRQILDLYARLVEEDRAFWAAQAEQDRQWQARERAKDVRCYLLCLVVMICGLLIGSWLVARL